MVQIPSNPLAPPIATPTSSGLMSPSGTRVDLNDTTIKKERRDSLGQNHLNDTGTVIWNSLIYHYSGVVQIVVVKNVCEFRDTILWFIP